MINLEVIKNKEDLNLPYCKYSTDAGRDLYASETKTIHANTTEVVRTGLRLQLKLKSNKEKIITMPSYRQEDRVRYEIMWDLMDLWFETNFKHYIQLGSRSGLALKKGIQVIGGVIDEGYTDEIKIIISNPTKKSVTLSKGTRIAQAIIFAIPQIDQIIEVESFDISKISRGENGFGSTG